MSSVSRLAVLFGVAGLIPFVTCAAAILTMPQHSVSLLSYFYLYSAGILAFMAGVYWPIAMQLDNRCYPLSPLVTMLLSQLFFVIAGLGLVLSIPVQILLYPLAYLGLYFVDARWMRVYWPAWYLKLRVFLTLVAVTSQLIVGVWFYLVHG